MKRRRMLHGAIVIFLFLTLAMGPVGCSKVNKENYDQLKVGMGYDQVVELIGKPDTCEESVLGTKRCVWTDSAKQIKINFVADKAMLMSSKNL